MERQNESLSSSPANYAKLVIAARLLVQEEPVTLLLDYVGDDGFQQQALETEQANDDSL